MGRRGRAIALCAALMVTGPFIMVYELLFLLAVLLSNAYTYCACEGASP